MSHQVAIYLGMKFTIQFFWGIISLAMKKKDPFINQSVFHAILYVGFERCSIGFLWEGTG